MKRPAVPAGAGRWALGGLVALVVILAVGGIFPGCGAPEGRTLPPPSSTTSTDPTTTTTTPDFSRVALDPVPGETTTTGLVATGATTLRGVVEGPDGPVAGATVRAERLVGTAVQRHEATTGADGTFSLAGVPGGRYRVRAFLPGSLAMDDAEVFYVADGDTHDLRLRLRSFTGLVVTASTNPRTPFVGDGVNLAVLVAARTVDDDGIARAVPQAGVSVRISTTGWTTVGDGRTLQLTGSDGVAVFEFRCDRVTAVTATAVVGADEAIFALDPPACAARPTTTSAPEDQTTTTGAGGDTTTTADSATTTRPRSSTTRTTSGR